MPYEVSTEISFSAAHFLAGYEGDCARMHGHNWRVRVTLRAAGPDRLPGLTYDFRKLRALLGSVAEAVDHTVLNDLPFFKVKNPTAEALAEWFYWEVAGRLDDDSVTVARSEVWESPLNCAAYFRE